MDALALLTTYGAPTHHLTALYHPHPPLIMPVPPDPLPSARVWKRTCMRRATPDNLRGHDRLDALRYACVVHHSVYHTLPSLSTPTPHSPWTGAPQWSVTCVSRALFGAAAPSSPITVHAHATIPVAMTTAMRFDMRAVRTKRCLCAILTHHFARRRHKLHFHAFHVQ